MFIMNFFKNALTKKKYSTYVTHTAKLSLSVVLKHFSDKHRELFFLDIKVTLSEMSNDVLRKFVILTMLERGKS